MGPSKHTVPRDGIDHTPRKLALGPLGFQLVLERVRLCLLSSLESLLAGCGELGASAFENVCFNFTEAQMV